MTPSMIRCLRTSFFRVFRRVCLSGEQVVEVSVGHPNPSKFPTQSDVLGVTVMMITAFYRKQEFFRCSYFVYNNFNEERGGDHSEFAFDALVRSILVEKPRIRLYEIMWDYSKTVKMVPENVGKLGKEMKINKAIKKQSEKIQRKRKGKGTK